jgi:pyruvate-ferredoxin/flavodoxin oxidoreductase
MARKIAAQLLQFSLGDGNTPPVTPPSAEAIATGAVEEAPTSAGAAEVAGTRDDEGYTAPWIDTSQCTACDECMNLNPKIFAYNEKKLAYIKDAGAGPYKDLVRAAEKCTAKVIHPGYPADRMEKGVDKLIKRAEKFN